MKLSKELVVCFLALCACSIANAQTSNGTTLNAAVVSVVASNTTQCPVAGQHPVPKGYQVPLMVSNDTYSDTVSTGYCNIPVTWTTPFASTSYAVSCTPETGSVSTSAGFLYTPSVVSKTATGFTLVVNYFLENYDSNPTEYTTSSLPTEYVDCVAVSL